MTSKDQHTGRRGGRRSPRPVSADVPARAGPRGRLLSADKRDVASDVVAHLGELREDRRAARQGRDGHDVDLARRQRRRIDDRDAVESESMARRVVVGDARDRAAARAQRAQGRPAAASGAEDRDAHVRREWPLGSQERRRAGVRARSAAFSCSASRSRRSSAWTRSHPGRRARRRIRRPATGRCPGGRRGGEEDGGPWRSGSPGRRRRSPRAGRRVAGDRRLTRRSSHGAPSARSACATPVVHQRAAAAASPACAASQPRRNAAPTVFVARCGLKTEASASAHISSAGVARSHRAWRSHAIASA